MRATKRMSTMLHFPTRSAGDAPPFPPLGVDTGGGWPESMNGFFALGKKDGLER